MEAIMFGGELYRFENMDNEIECFFFFFGMRNEIYWFGFGVRRGVCIYIGVSEL